MTSKEEIAKNMRNLILEGLIIISSKELQISYQKKVPIANVSAEIFCAWEGNYEPDWDILDISFSKDELEALKKFNNIYENLCVEDPLPYIEEMFSTSYWKKYNQAAIDILKYFPKDEINNMIASIEKRFKKSQ